jgi:hypothetical protein
MNAALFRAGGTGSDRHPKTTSLNHMENEA